MKIVVNMLSKADSVDGQGVGSAYIEQVNLIKEMCSDYFETRVNSHKKADIIHIHSINPTYLIRRKRGGVKIAYCHFLPETLDGSIKLPKLLFGLFKKYVVYFYRKVDYLIVVNPIFINNLISLGIKKERIKYIPNFVSKDSFYQMNNEEKLSIRDKYDIPHDKFVVMGCGQIQTRKGVLDFVEVAKMNPDILFIWCGGFSFSVITDGYEELKKIVDNPPVDNIKFLGIIPRNEMNGMFNMADCLFMPSYNELFPMSILEAASTSTPVVLRNLDLYKDVLFDYYVAADNNENFSKLIRKMKDDSTFYLECQEKSNKIAKEYSKENVASIWKEFYLKIYKENQDKKKKK